jgi:hypothetical protein
MSVAHLGSYAPPGRQVFIQNTVKRNGLTFTLKAKLVRLGETILATALFIVPVTLHQISLAAGAYLLSAPGVMHREVVTGSQKYQIRIVRAGVVGPVAVFGRTRGGARAVEARMHAWPRIASKCRCSRCAHSFLPIALLLTWAWAAALYRWI